MNPSPDQTLVKIQLKDAGKRYNREWIFKNIHFEFQMGTAYAITGPNGSGKSTLLQAIAGSLQLSKGEANYCLASQRKLETDQFYQWISITAPYLELIEEMTAKEMLSFHHQFKPLQSGLEIESLLEEIGLAAAMNKQIRYYSSGMKQRLKLAQAIFSSTPILLLDEPCTNLDANGYALYQALIAKYAAKKLIVVSSNDAAEMAFCTEKLCISDYK